MPSQARPCGEVGLERHRLHRQSASRELVAELAQGPIVREEDIASIQEVRVNVVLIPPVRRIALRRPPIALEDQAEKSDDGVVAQHGLAETVLVETHGRGSPSDAKLVELPKTGGERVIGDVLLDTARDDKLDLGHVGEPEELEHRGVSRAMRFEHVAGDVRVESEAVGHRAA